MSTVEMRSRTLTRQFVVSDPEWWKDVPKLGSKNDEGMECISVEGHVTDMLNFYRVTVTWRD